MSSLLEKPALGRSQVTLRPYQEEAIAAVRHEFARGHRSTLLVQPCGAGKTITFGYIARLAMERSKRSLILAHREELIDQAANKLDLLGIDAAIEKGASRARALWEPDVVIASVPTMQGDRLASWAPDHFDLLIIDEAHHSLAKTYRRIIEYFPRARLLGVTATPERGDGEKLGEVYESIAYEMSLWDAMTAPDPGPYLSRLTFVQCAVKVDLSDIRTTGGDLNQADLEKRIRPHVEELANAIKQEIGQRTTLVFCPDVGSSQAMASALASLGLTADWSSGVDPGRKHKLERLEAGDLQVLCNCSLFLEGVDVPRIAAIALCRPTQSPVLYRQQVGRGTRLYPGKENCLIIDFDFQTQRHNLVQAAELFDTHQTDPKVLALAQASLLAKPHSDLMDAIAEARAESRRQTILSIQARERQANYRRVSYDPLAVFETLGVAWRGSKQNKVVTRATPRQVETLKKFGIDDADNFSKTRATTLLDYLFARKKQGLATVKQLSWCIAKGYDPDGARQLSFDQASAFLDRAFSRRA